MNVVIYARFSSHSQTEQSIEGQLKVCYEYAESNHYTVVGEYIDRAISGTTDNRAEFQRMISDSDRHTFEGVLVYQLDRFARNRYDSAINKAKLKKNGVRVRVGARQCAERSSSSPPVTRILLLRCSCYFYTHARFSNLRLIFTRYDKICIIIPEGDPMRILLAEDEKSLNRIITKQLKAAGYSVDSCFDGGEAYDLITSTDYDAAVFDVMMPIMNGFELVKKIRAHGIDTPVLFLTARDSIEDRVTGLDIGADDYLIKPFSFDELSARLRVMTRKKYGEKTGIISVGDLTVDTAARRVERAGREISLSAKEYELLQYLVMNKGVVLSREKIEDHIWNYDYEGGTNVVDVYIRYLRKKIDEGEDIKLIHTVRGAGYVIK